VNSDAEGAQVAAGWGREVMWRREDGGIEHVQAADGGDRGTITVDGVVAWPGADGGGRGGAALDHAGDGSGRVAGSDDVHRVRYTLRCDASWRVREVRVEAPEDGTSVILHADGEGHWHDSAGAALAHLEGCVDVDLYAVAFTNTLPVRRLHMAVGEAHTIDVAFILLPSMEVQHVAQRYTRVSDNLYRYEAVTTGFTADLQLDGDGLVVTYPGLVRRMWAR
jgi:uncharacterized protein